MQSDWVKRSYFNKFLKQAPAICFALSGKARETALELDIQSLNHEDGVKIVFERLDRLYLRDREQTIYAAYDNFENLCDQ